MITHLFRRLGFLGCCYYCYLFQLRHSNPPQPLPALISYLYTQDLPCYPVNIHFCFMPGVVMIPGVTQLTEKDLKYRLQASRAKSIITSDSLAPRVDAISAECPSLQTKLLVSDSDSRPGWLNFRELLR